MIVLHVDINTGKAAMFSVPRNTICVPLPPEIAKHYATNDKGCPGNTWPYMLNWLAGEAGWGSVTTPKTGAATKNFPFYQSPTAGQPNDTMAIPQGRRSHDGGGIDADRAGHRRLRDDKSRGWSR